MAGKSPEMEKFLENFSKNFLAQPRSKAFRTNTCVRCKMEATTFRDGTSKKDYEITGMCQSCQDGFYSKAEADEEA
jgi:hypothetical protein